MDRFAELLSDLGRVMGLPLHPDKKRVCQLNVNNLFHVQLCDDSSKERVLIATFVADIPAGKFRENILRDTLKSNGVLPLLGTWGYSERNNKLALFAYIPYASFTGEKVADYLAQFLDKAQAWRTAIETGTPPPLSTSASNKGDRSIFGSITHG